VKWIIWGSDGGVMTKITHRCEILRRLRTSVAFKKGWLQMDVNRSLQATVYVYELLTFDNGFSFQYFLA